MGESSLLDVIFKDIKENEWIAILTLSDSEEPAYLYAHNAKEVYEKIASLTGTRNCYFGVAIRSKRAGLKDAVGRITALWAETDSKDFKDDKAAAGLAIAKCIIPPSFIVDSGHGYHGYWLLNTPLSLEETEALLPQLIESIGGDSHLSDASRFMRIPGSLNHKETPPLPCRMIDEHPDLIYSVDDVKALLSLNRGLKKAILEGKPPTGAKDKTRSGADWNVTLQLMRAGVSKDAIQILFGAHPIGEKYREPGGDRYFLHTLEEATKRLEQQEDYFTEKKDRYVITGKGGQVDVSTFVFVPKRLLRGAEEDRFLGEIHAGGKVWHSVILPKKAFNGIDGLLRCLGNAQWQWLGTDRDVRFLLPHVVTKWQSNGASSAEATEILGRHGDVWVSADMTLGATGPMDIYTAPIVYSESNRVRPIVTLRPVLDDDEQIEATVRRLSELIPTINEPSVLWPILGWFFATPLKPIFNKFQVRFPHLELYGTKGSGKSSTVLQVFFRLLSYSDPQSHDCRTTPYVMLALMSSTNSLPVSLSEFRQSTLQEKEYNIIKRTLLLSYDVGHDSRGRANQTTVDYPLSAPIVLDGEDVVTDPAIQERTIFVNLDPRTIVEQSAQWLAFRELTQLSLERIAYRYLKYTLKWNEVNLRELWQACSIEVRDAYPTVMADRVRRNLTTVLCGIRLYEQFLSSENVFVAPVHASVLQTSLDDVHKKGLGRGSLGVDELVTDIINEIAMGSAVPPFLYMYHQVDNVLWFHLGTAMAWWYQERRRRGMAVMDSAAIKSQLKERSDIRPGPGQYISGPQATHVPGGTCWMYGIRITTCFESGLDIPDLIAPKQVIIQI